MRPLRTLTSRRIHGTLTLLTIGVIAAWTGAAPPEESADRLTTGAKLLRRFKTEVYRTPVLLETKAGPRLLVWIDAFDPTAPTRFPGEPQKDPVFDLSFWDIKADKEIDKMSYPKQPAPLAPVAPSAHSPGMFGPLGQLAFSSDGKQFAFVSTSYRMVPGKVNHEATGTIQMYDLETHKSKAAIGTEWKRENNKYNFPCVLFAPDGALVILMEATCTVHEPGKASPRMVFDLVRAPNFEADTVAYAIREAVLSPDGGQLAVAADGTVTVYDLAAGKAIFEAPRAAPDAKGNSGVNNARVSLAFAPGKDVQKVLAVEIVTGPPKSFVLARLFDLKEKKEIANVKLAEAETGARAAQLGNPAPPNWGRAYAFFTPKGEPRILFDGKLVDGANGKVLDEFDPGAGLILSRDGKYLVRLNTVKDDKKRGIELWSLDNQK
jgi:hypothetical protein